MAKRWAREDLILKFHYPLQMQYISLLQYRTRDVMSTGDSKGLINWAFYNKRQVECIWNPVNSVKLQRTRKKNFHFHSLLRK